MGEVGRCRGLVGGHHRQELLDESTSFVLGVTGQLVHEFGPFRDDGQRSAAEPQRPDRDVDRLGVSRGTLRAAIGRLH